MNCNQCGTRFEGNFCPNCGAPVSAEIPVVNNAQMVPAVEPKKKKPIYKKWWFWVIIVVVAIGVIGGSGDGDENSDSTYNDYMSEENMHMEADNDYLTEETSHMEADNDFINGEKVDGEILDIEVDNISEKLCSFGFTGSEAQEIREIFLLCGITDIDGAEPTDPNATIDGLIAYRYVIDDDRTVWFTIDKRELFYIALNGVDVYDTDKGGFLININDVHIPESEISVSVKNTLRDLAESTLDVYFINANYYDAWGVARSDDDYMTQCEVYATNKLGIKDWIKAKVWFKYDGKNYNVTAVVIDGVRYK